MVFSINVLTESGSIASAYISRWASVAAVLFTRAVTFIISVWVAKWASTVDFINVILWAFFWIAYTDEFWAVAFSCFAYSDLDIDSDSLFVRFAARLLDSLADTGAFIFDTLVVQATFVTRVGDE